MGFNVRWQSWWPWVALDAGCGKPLSWSARQRSRLRRASMQGPSRWTLGAEAISRPATAAMNARRGPFEGLAKSTTTDSSCYPRQFSLFCAGFIEGNTSCASVRGLWSASIAGPRQRWSAKGKPRRIAEYASANWCPSPGRLAPPWCAELGVLFTHLVYVPSARRRVRGPSNR
jgi:hypothetical protein